MTERKPIGMGFESWVDKQIREATERGEFDNLPGAGEPIRDLNTPYDEVWVRRLLSDEGATPEDMLPTPLRLRREIEKLPETVRPLRSEQAVREAAEELNARILAWLRTPLDGPAMPVGRVDVDAVVEAWRADRTPNPTGPRTTGATTPSPSEESSKPAERRRWWHRISRPSS